MAKNLMQPGPWARCADDRLIGIPGLTRRLNGITPEIASHIVDRVNSYEELATALRDLLREVRKISDVCLPDGFDARAVRNAEAALAAAAGVKGGE